MDVTSDQRPTVQGDAAKTHGAVRSGADSKAHSGADSAADSGADSAAHSGADSAADSGADSAAHSSVAEVEHQLGTLVRQLYATARRAAARIDPSLPPFGLKLLRLLVRSGPSHASACAEFLDVDRSFVSRQVKQLEELGLVEVRVDESDGRARLLAVTPLAVERMSRVDDTSASATRRELDTWEGDDLRRFAGYLARLTDAES